MATEKNEETGPEKQKTETISVVINSLSAEKIKLLSQQRDIIDMQIRTIATTLFEAEGHEVLNQCNLSFSEGFKKVSFVKNVEQDSK